MESLKKLTPRVFASFTLVLGVTLAFSLKLAIAATPNATTKPAGKSCENILKKIAKTSIEKGLVASGDEGLDCCRLPNSDGSGNLQMPSEIDSTQLSLNDQLVIARRFVSHSLETSYGPETDEWRDYAPNPDPLDRARRMTVFLFSSSDGARIPPRISDLLAQEVKTNYLKVREARQRLGNDARPLAEKYISKAFADYSADIVAMFQNSRESLEDFFQPLVHRIQFCRLSFKQVLEDSDALVRIQSELFLAIEQLRAVPELATNPRFREFQEQVDVAFFRRYTDLLAPNNPEVMKTLAALATGDDPSPIDRLAPISSEARKQLFDIYQRLVEAQTTLQASRREYAQGYRAAAMDLALLNRLGRPGGEHLVESTNVLRLLDRDKRLSSGELYAGLYKAALDVIVSQGFFTDNYLNFTINDITSENIGAIIRAAGSVAGPRVFSVIMDDERMRHEFNLGEMEALNQEHAAIEEDQKLAKQIRRTDTLVWLADKAYRGAKLIFPGGSKIPDDVITKALNSQRQVLATHGFQEVNPAHAAPLPKNMNVLLESCHTELYTKADLSVDALLKYLDRELGPMPDSDGPPPPQRLTLEDDLLIGLSTLPESNSGAKIDTAEAAIQVLQGSAPQPTPSATAADAGDDVGTLALQRKLWILSRRAKVVRKFDLELSIRELNYRKVYANDPDKLKVELAKLDSMRETTWKAAHHDLQDRLEEVAQVTTDAFMRNGVDRSVALASLADALPTDLRHFLINLGGRVREKLVPLYSLVIIRVINDLNPLQLENTDQLKDIAAAAATSDDIRKGLRTQRKVAYLAVGSALFFGGVAIARYGVPAYVHLKDHKAALTRPAPATPGKPALPANGAPLQVPLPATPH